MLADGPLPFGRLWDCGMVQYREFACSVETFEWLREGAMRVLDGVPVRLVVAERCVGGHNVIVKCEPREGVRDHAPATYAWQSPEAVAA